MDALKYLLPRPSMLLSAEDRAAFDALFVSAQHAPEGHIAYDLPAPKWQFLAYLTERKAILLHGSSDPNIADFQPHQSLDLAEFGAQTGVYATSDGIWPIFYAILDHEHHPMMLHNACILLEDSEGAINEPLYFFSITQDALDQRPFHSGTVYVLPRTTFTQQAAQTFGGMRAHVPQWMSPVAVKPLAKLDVSPDDFPFLNDIRGHNDERLTASITSNPGGFPWVD